MNPTHPFVKYGLAVVLAENNLEIEKVENDELLAKTTLEVQRGLNSFRVHPIELYENKESVKFDFVNRKEGGATDKGVFLSSNILTKDKPAGNLYKCCQDYIEGKAPDRATMAVAPISGEFLSFGENETGRGKPKISSLEAGLCLIASTTRWKPCLAFKDIKKGKTERTNIAIMPDLPLPELLKFVRLFKQMSLDLEGANVGRVFQEKDKKTGQVKKWVPLRPRRFDGNFPHAPRSSALGSIALLGAIGTWSKEAEFKGWGDEVLDSLKGTQIYIVSYGKAQAFRYSHHIVELAKEDRLTKIVDSIYYSILFNEGARNDRNKERYQPFDLFTARFLMQFNQPAFRDFLAFRAEYPEPVFILLKSYFLNMEKIEPAIVASARVMGKWLNLAAYIAAKNDVNPNMANPSDREKLYKQKAKFLVELESSVYGSRTSDALAFQAVVRAARLSGMDAPEGGAYFLEEICKGEKLSLDQAKHLLIAFSRIRNKTERKETPPEAKSEVDELDEQTGEEDFENA